MRPFPENRDRDEEERKQKWIGCINQSEKALEEWKICDIKDRKRQSARKKQQNKKK
jgi:hypothetical protein